MVKKIVLIIIVLAVAFLSLSELKAGKKAAESVTTVGAPIEISLPQPGKTAEQETQPEQQENVGMSEDQQRALIMDHYDLWAEAWSYGEDWFYTVTDLDHNGRLEVITASLQGSGLYTYAEIWEVREDFSGIAKCTDSLGEGEAYPDIITEATSCFYDEASGLYWYLFDDVARSGMAENYTAKVALCLDNGAIELHYINSKYEKYEDADSEPQVSYGDGEGNPITKEEYEQTVANWAVGMTMSDYALEWTEVRANN